MTTTALSETRVVALVEEAARPVPLLWPLSAAVAANPLWDLRDLGFSAAVDLVGRLFGASGYPSPDHLAAAYRTGRITDADLAAARRELLAEQPRGQHAGPKVLAGPGRGALTFVERHDRRFSTAWAPETDRQVVKWAAAYLARVVPEVPGGGFFPAWVSAVASDRRARRLGLPGQVAGVPAARALALALRRLGIDDEEAALFELTGQLVRLPGWAAHGKWRSRWAVPDQPGPALGLVDYLAVRLAYDAAVVQSAGPTAVGLPMERADTATTSSADAKRRLWLRASEIGYRDRLLASLRPFGAATEPADVGDGPVAQVVCCIDTRSEGLRRHLEAVGPYATLGFAGFFGVPARLRPAGSEEALDLCPVLLHPTIELSEQPADGFADRDLSPARDLAAAEASLRAGRKGTVGAFMLAEAGGFALGPLAALRSAAPRVFAALRQGVVDQAAPVPEPAVVLEGRGAPADVEQALYAETALRVMGLTEGFAPLVVFCGHGSTTENNPYASALDCGACGAARGGRSARLAAAICNRPAVRSLLAERNIHVPESTVFVAAEHDTATDAVNLFPPSVKLCVEQAERLERVGTDLARAGSTLAAERAAVLPGSSTANRKGQAKAHVRARSADWAQVQPEWGLARCAAFVVAARSLTLGVDLERRVFLHSYDRRADDDGAVLETILTGPMIVAQWISAAYYFSTTDPHLYGAGDKVAHNVVAGVAVYQGASGDLQIGLPRQAVFDGHLPYHEPMRLLAVIDAPRSRIDAVIGRNQVLSELTDGEWIHLVACDEGRFWTRRPVGSWQRWVPAAAALHQGGAVNERQGGRPTPEEVAARG